MTEQKNTQRAGGTRPQKKRDMNTDTIKRIFQSQFDYKTYCNEIVHNIFGCNDIATSPEQLPSSSDGDHNYFIGRMADADRRELGFFYTRVAEGSDVRRKRVGLRKLIAPYLKYEVDAAIAVFDDGNHWRLSYICDMKEDATATKRFSYILGDPQGQYKTPIERLSKVASKSGRFVLNDLKEAFSVDALSKEFFDEYHRHYDIIVKELEREGNSGTIYHDYVKKMLGRIVFLHFLQKKGWLDGNQAFLRDLFFMQPLDRRADFLEKVMEPLFFGIFNTEIGQRGRLFSDRHWDKQLLEGWSALPYLNGGLFEEDAVDKLHIKLPGSLFEDLFTFLASYNFTVDENDPDDAEVGVDPEMLGKIFESLLEDNKAKGAFYTPKEIVRYMCKESLIAYLMSKLENSSDVQNASKRQNARSANNPTQGTQCGNGENITATTNASERLNAQSANNPTQGTQCGDNDRNEKCVSETRDLTSNGENSGGLPDASARLNAQSANNPTQGTQCGGSECVSETRDLKTAIRAFVEHHEMQPELEPYHDALDAALRNVKICDPAIGSGAFPMGLLNELWRCREALMDAADTSERCDLSNTVQAKRSAVTSTEKPLRAGGTRPQTRVELKKQIIENNIYGVDIERGAIDIARLRFWLSIVVDAEEPEPLPNFDYKFMQGNSLIESYKGIDLSRISNRLRGGQSKSTQLLLGLDSDFSKKNLQLLIRDYFKTADHKQKSSMRQAINDEVKRLITDFIGGTAADLDKLDPSAYQDFFLWHTWFKDIFDNGGFDIVIGNPPYFKYEGKNKNEIDSIRKSQYLEIAFGGKLNAYKLFLALSINKICKSNGIISLIFQNSFIADKQASILRREVINKHQIITIDSFPERDSKKKRVFENVKMSVCILLMQKSVTGKRFNVNFWNDKYKSSGTNIKFSGDEIKRIDNEDYCIPRIEQKTIPLVIKLRQMNKFPLKCYEGELNMTFHKSFFNSNPNNPTILKGAAIQRYYITYRMSQGEIEYLDEKRYLTENSSEKAFHHEQERLAMQGMTGANDKIRLVMTIVPRGVYLANSCNYIIPTKELPAKYLLGLMNSHLMNWYFRCFSTNSNVNGYEVENFPMPNDNTDIRREITELVDIILRLKANNASVDTSEQEQQIDKLVYQLYNLTPEEIAIIEQP